jgi:hypothetical protein
MLRKKLGIKVISVAEKLGTEDNIMNDLMEAIIECMDEYYSINLAEEVKRGMINKVKNGEIVFRPPYGYKIENGKAIIKDDEAEYVRMIFDDFNNGLGLKQIAMKYSDMGIVGWYGKLIDTNRVSRMIRNPIYIGKIRWSENGKKGHKYDKGNDDVLIVDGIHKPIIDIDVFEKAQFRADEISKKYQKHAKQNEKVTFLLKGLVRCSSCGRTLTRLNLAYQCCGYSRGICKVSHYIKQSVLENTVIDFLLGVKPDNIKIIPPDLSPIKKKTFNEQKKRLDAKAERIKDAFEAGIYTIDEFRSRLSKIETELSKLDIVESPEKEQTRRLEIIDKCSVSLIEIIKSDDIPLSGKMTF